MSSCRRRRARRHMGQTRRVRRRRFCQNRGGSDDRSCGPPEGWFLSRQHSKNGAAVEVTLAHDLGGGGWRAFAKGARRLHSGDRIEFAADLSARVGDKGEHGEVALHFDCEGEAFRSALARHGAMPLPPYIKRPRGGDTRDRSDYQTIFARTEGAVAAPTAGLHFTSALLDRLAAP